MECHPLEVVIFRKPEDGGVPCSLGFGSLCQVRLRRADLSNKTPWVIYHSLPCEIHEKEWQQQRREGWMAHVN